jgi:hypothetical protein
MAVEHLTDFPGPQSYFKDNEPCCSHELVMKNCNQEKVVLQQAYENFTSMLNDKQKILLPTPHHMFAEKSSTSPCFAVHLVQEILYSFNISSNTLFCTNPITNDIFIATIEPL